MRHRTPPRAKSAENHWVGGVAKVAASVIEVVPGGVDLPSLTERAAAAELWGVEVAVGRYALFEWDGRRPVARGR